MRVLSARRLAFSLLLALPLGRTLMSKRRNAAKGTRPRTRQLGGSGQSATAVAPTSSLDTGHAPAQLPDAVEPEALVSTWWFDSGDTGEPYSATVRFTGRRVGVRGNPGASDTFVKDEAIADIVPGTGPVSITTFVYGLQPGDWHVKAELVGATNSPTGTGPAARSRHLGGRPVLPGAWSWRRWAIATREAGPVKTRWALLAPLALQPAVIPGVYTAVAVVGFFVALALQAAILSGRGIEIGPPLAASVIGSIAGLIGAKVWYAVLHPDESVIKGGWAVDGWLMVAPLVAAVTMFAWSIPIGTVLDATAPGIFFAVAMGRVGCFFTGCCSGRCTASRWGIWSSDRRVGTRRIPTQLIESGAGLLIGVVSLAVVLADVVPLAGAVFVAAFAAYAVIRQFLLRLRVEQRASYRTLPATAAAAAVTSVLVVALSLLQTG